MYYLKEWYLRVKKTLYKEHKMCKSLAYFSISDF